MFAVSVVHGGPAPALFTKAVVDFLLFGLNGAKASVMDIPNPLVRESVEKVRLSQYCNI